MIRMFDYLEQYRTIESEIQTAIVQVLESGQLILGEQVLLFEQRFSEFLGEGVESVAVNSGTDALAVALMGLAIGRGAEVVTVSNTAVPTISAIRETGATPVFCDVDPKTGLMDLENLEATFAAETRAIVPVHLFGNVVDVPRIRSIIAGRPIRIVEDCAQAHGATLRGRMAGTFGDAAAFSFYPTKNLGAYGDAGLCCTRDPTLAKEMRKIRMYGFDGAYYSEREGINSRLDEIQAAVLNVKLTSLPQYIQRRRELADVYEATLADTVKRLPPGDGVEHAYHLFVVVVLNRDLARKRLQEEGIDTGIHYPCPIHLMRGFSFLGYQEASLPYTEALCRGILSLPMYPELSPESARFVATTINRCVS